MSDIKLVSEEYTSRFITGPQLQTELSKKQDDVGLSIDDDGNVLVYMKGIGQNGSMYENYFDGSTTFGSGVEIQGQRPVLDVTSSDDSVTVTRSADGYDVDLKANSGGSKWVTDESYGGRTWVSLGKDKYDATVNSVFVSGPLYDKDGKEIKGGASAGGSKWIHDDYDPLMGETVNIGPGTTYPENARLIYIEWPADGLLMFRCGQTDLGLDRVKLQKLKEWLES